jgi:threonine aldolase
MVDVSAHCKSCISLLAHRLQRLSISVWRGFASDNYAGIHPEILAAIGRANEGHQVAYGDDDITSQLREIFIKHFGETAQVFPVFNGTGANVVALQGMISNWEAVICATSAHVNVDEGGAPEKVAGIKLWTIPTSDGKLTPELIAGQAWGFGDVHRAQPAVVTITQPTELGTLYSVEEIKAIAEYAHSKGMKLHMDGARIANAAAALGLGLREFTTDAGVDVLSFGGTKNGGMGCEAVVVLNPDLANRIPFIRKSAMQLASKMRFISAQLDALLVGDLWLRSARHANEMAKRLEREVRNIEGIVIAREVQANSVFALLPQQVTERLQRRFRFYVWDQSTGEVRWMCSWDTTEEDVDMFTRAIKEEMAK